MNENLSTPLPVGGFRRLTTLWWHALEDTFPEFQRTKGHTFHEDCDYFREVILPNNQVWVAEADGTIAGFMAIKASFIDQIFVDPSMQRKGIGRALLDQARKLSPEFLRLETFQSNRNGRAFYEKNGFRAVKFSVSPPPDNRPVVEYQWP